MEGRIRHLAAILENAEIVEATDAERGVARHHRRGHRYEGDDDVERYLIGSIEERATTVEVITPGSPLGEALIGAQRRRRGRVRLPGRHAQGRDRRDRGLTARAPATSP